MTVIHRPYGRVARPRELSTRETFSRAEVNWSVNLLIRNPDRKSVVTSRVQTGLRSGHAEQQGDSMHDFHRLRFSTARSRRLQGILVPLRSPLGLSGESLCVQNSSSLSMLMPITRGIANASPVRGARFRNDYTAPAAGSLRFAIFGSFVSIHQRQALLACLICIDRALGTHFLLRQTLKPVHFESI